MQTQWVQQFRNCPDSEDIEALVLAEEAERAQQVLAREREGAGGLVDGYVLQRFDAQSRTALYTWVRAGSAEQVAAYLLDLLAEVCPVERPR
ncbi:hypothetical protein [Kitasatospora sp. NPDC005751]|uniref:hypothetical protein n=1 Tax=unclassified Kitasatospora TaxID=2633591 RepID=UPI003409BAA7